MRYVSIDIETTGLNPKYCQILEFGAVIEDTNNILPDDQLPSLRLLLGHDRLVGESFAINMNMDLIAESLEKGTILTPPDIVAKLFCNFLTGNGFQFGKSINVAGKNFAGFDNLFLQKLPQWSNLIKTRHRVLDPAILYFDPLKDDVLPDLKECKKRAGFVDVSVDHTAVADAIDVIRLLRYKLGYVNV